MKLLNQIFTIKQVNKCKLLYTRYHYSYIHNHKPIKDFNILSSIKTSNDLILLTNQTINKCNIIRDVIYKSSNSYFNNKIILNIGEILLLYDSLSNIICLTIDSAELFRNVHSNEVYRQTCEHVYDKIGSYISELNSDVVLYNILKDIKELYSKQSISLTSEQVMFLYDMINEYENDGIHLSNQLKEQLNQYINQLNQYESLYIYNITNNDDKLITFGPIADNNLYNYLNKHIDSYINLSNMSKQTNYLHTTSNKRLVNGLLSYIPNESIRKHIYINSHIEPNENKELVGKIVKLKQLIAKQLGYHSYTDKYLYKFIYKSSNEIMKYLDKISISIKPFINQDIKTLKQIKDNYSDSKIDSKLNNTSIYPWDINYIMFEYNKINKQTNQSSNVIREYLSIDSCLFGLQYLSTQLFDIKLVRQVDIPDDELWIDSNIHDEIVKYNIYDIDSQLIGIIYIDIYNRSNKFTGVGHFTIQCGCVSSNTTTTNILNKFNNQLVNQSVEYNYQIPIIALVFNYSSDLLSLFDLETLYHEYGHALHSILSKTTYQHLSGTRCPVDFAEVPSHLFEYFARSPEVISQWAYHYKTKERIPIQLLEKSLLITNQLGSLEIQRQILYSVVDQYLFSDLLGDVTALDPNDIYNHCIDIINKLQLQYTDISIDENNSRDGLLMPLLTHNHLTTYGGSYFSYLFARMYAAQIWHKRFKDNPLSKENGYLLRDQMLRYGGSKPSIEVLNELADGELDPQYFLNKLDLL